MNKTIFIAMFGTASLVASADAGILGFSCFGRTASNGNIVIDVAVVTERPSDRVLNVFNVNTTQPGNPAFVQQAGLSTRGFKPDAATSNRSNSVDSFCTIGVQGGAPYYGEYYAAGNTGPDGGFTTGWTTLGTSMPSNAGWFISPPTGLENASESLSNFTGYRNNTSAAAAGGSVGVWVAHWVFAQGMASFTFSISASVKDGVSGATTTSTATNFSDSPAPGALALLGIAGTARSRRRP